MSLEKILSISGKPGLYKLTTQTRSGFLAESLVDGKKISVGGLEALEQTTTSLTTAEMSEYLDKIQRFCASEMGVFVPLPEEAQLR